MSSRIRTSLLAVLLLAGPALAQQKISLFTQAAPRPGGTTGCLVYSSSGTTTMACLPIGTTGQVLRVTSGLPAWVTFLPSMIGNGTEGDVLVAGASVPAFGKNIGKQPTSWTTTADADYWRLHGKLSLGIVDGNLPTSASNPVFTIFAGHTGASIANSVDAMAIYSPNLGSLAKQTVSFGSTLANFKGFIQVYEEGNHSIGVPTHFYWHSVESLTGRALEITAQDSGGGTSTATPDGVRVGLDGADVTNPTCVVQPASFVVGCYGFSVYASDGNLVFLRGLQYDWPPVSTGHVAGYLHNDGTGQLRFGMVGIGSVTSVAVSGGTTGLTTSGGPITTSGTITFAGTLVVANGGTGGATRTLGFNNLAPASSVKGDVLVNDGTDWVRLAVGGTNGWVLQVDSTAATGVKWGAFSAAVTSINGDTATAQLISAGTGVSVVTSGGTTTISCPSCAGGGSASRQWILADPGYSLGTAFERVNHPAGGWPGLIQLKAARTFSVTHANAIAATTTMEGWTSRNTANITTADSNTTVANGLYVQHNTSATDDQFGGTDTGAQFYRAIDSGISNYDAIARVKLAFTQAGQFGGLEIQEATPSNNWCRVSFDTTTIGAAWTINGTGTGGASVNFTGTQKTDGVWLRLLRVGPDCAMFYNTAVQATPPGTWTLLDKKAGVFSTTAVGGALPMRVVLLGPTRFNTTPTTNTNQTWLYFDEMFVPDPFVQIPGTYGLAAAGFSDASPVLTIVSGYDLGASTATVADADLQAIATEITNLRAYDTATVTWSGSRCASAPCACGGGSYASAATHTAGGTGRYLSHCVKLLSTGRVLPGSVQVSTYRLPFQP